MRLVIALCRHCLRDQGNCLYRQRIVEAINKIKIKRTVSHRCPIYRTLVPVVSPYKRDDSLYVYTLEDVGTLNKTNGEIIAEGETIGARVRVMLKELEYGPLSGGSCDSDPPEPYYEWHEVGEVMGTVCYRPAGKSKFFGIRLDEPVELHLPERGRSWNTVEKRIITERWLPANKLQFVTAQEAEG